MQHDGYDNEHPRPVSLHRLQHFGRLESPGDDRGSAPTDPQDQMENPHPWKSGDGTTTASRGRSGIRAKSPAPLTLNLEPVPRAAPFGRPVVPDVRITMRPPRRGNGVRASARPPQRPGR